MVGFDLHFEDTNLQPTINSLKLRLQRGAESARLVRDMGDAHFRAPLQKEQLEALKILDDRGLMHLGVSQKPLIKVSIYIFLSFL